MNLYQWEAKITDRFEDYGNKSLSLLLVACAIVIVLIALFSRSVVFKSLVAAYILLP